MVDRISGVALTFDDVLLVPAYSEVVPSAVSLTTKLCSKIELSIPMLSAAMDTVTESGLAIALAQEGGLGIIHKNLSIQQQAAEVRRVKKFESGVIRDPITIDQHAPISELHAIRKRFGISGVPVIDAANNSQVVGIVTQRDVRFSTDAKQVVSAIMTPAEKLITVGCNFTMAEAQEKMHANRIEKVIVVDDHMQLIGMVTVRDLLKHTMFPNACKDEHGALRVGAAIGIGAESQKRAEAIVAAGVDVLVVDTAHGHSRNVIETVSYMRKKFASVNLIAGNIATADAALRMADCGVDAVKVGIGPGSICTTRIISGVGMPQISAVSQVSAALVDSSVLVIADGGIRYSGDIAKVIAAGAHCVMVGSLLAGTDESPGEFELYQARSYKQYRGMGSQAAMKQGSSDRYFQEGSETDKLVPEGIEGRVPAKGPLKGVVHQLMGGVRSCMGYTGCATIDELRTKTKFVQITNAGMKESHVHDVQITKESPNYHV